MVIILASLTVLYPTHNNFEVYDAFVVYSNHGRAVSVYGYQLKESKSSKKPQTNNKLLKSFFVQGSPANETKTDGKGWTVPNKTTIDRFFGESGRHWTPERWRKFSENVALFTS